MKVKIWGSRGSIPASISAETIHHKIHRALKLSGELILKTDGEIERFIETRLPFAVKGSYGTNTSCAQIIDNDEYIVLDAGTGLRDLGNSIIQSGKTGCIIHIFLSHLHWDHIQGFPFFIPAFIKENTINFYSCHSMLEEKIKSQQTAPTFPVPIDYMKAKINYNILEAGKEYQINDFNVTPIEQSHPGLSYGYSFEKDGKKIVYSTDSEHKDAPDDAEKFENFFKGADLLIFDAQYTLIDAISTKENWGHSSNMVGVELAIKSEVKHLVMFHSEPTHSDETLDKNLEDTRKYSAIFEDSYPLEVSQAFDGMEIDV